METALSGRWAHRGLGAPRRSPRVTHTATAQLACSLSPLLVLPAAHGARVPDAVRVTRQQFGAGPE